MFDGRIIAACIEDARAYREIQEHVDVEEFTPIGSFWWKQIEAWYSRDPDGRAIDLVIFRERGMREAGRNSEAAGEYIENLPDAPSPGNVSWELLELKREIAWRKLAEVSEGEMDRITQTELAEEHLKLLHATDLRAEVSFDDISNILIRDPSTLIPLAPAALNDFTGGGADPGSHIVGFARVGAGKTAFAVSNVGVWLRANKRVLYIGNEEKTDRIAQRIRCNLATMDQEQCAIHESTMWKRCYEKGWENLRMKHMEPGSPEEVIQHVESFEPDCVVIDQLRNLRTASSRKGTRAQGLDAVASAVRQLSTKHNVVTLSLGQANAGEHGKPRIYFESDDFDESRTGVAAATDLMVAIGFDPALDAHSQRAFSVCKNSLTGDQGNFITTLDKKRSTYQ